MPNHRFKHIASRSDSLVATVNLITCPANTRYFFKRASLNVVQTTNVAKQFQFELSDTAGINFRKITHQHTLPGVIGVYFYNLSAPTTVAVTAIDPSKDIFSSLEGLVMEPGQILRLVPAGGSGGDTTQFVVSGFQYDEI